VRPEIAGLQILDVHDPDHPTSLGHYEAEGRALDVQVDGMIAYLAAGEGGMYAIDVRNPAAPSLISRFDTADVRLVSMWSIIGCTWRISAVA
jgi:hypothetical protein